MYRQGVGGWKSSRSNPFQVRSFVHTQELWLWEDEDLKNFLDVLKKSYDLMLIDCPPTQSLLTDAAYASSNYVLIPVRPEFLSTIGLPLLVKSLEDYEFEHQDHEIEIAGILFNAVSDGKVEHQKSKQDVMTLAKKNHWYVFKRVRSASRIHILRAPERVNPFF